ncbi:hypothetical protein [Nocardioides sp. SR21]|uniref:hypothetical protein n=1 Tax=Nocardioides sp. SR21 TaxID=2919501 RepID=UPI001FAAE4BA|nr:hypothetical protein [Nocardioides sp. SR21]
MDLDQLLDESAPPVTPRTPRLERDLHDLVAAAEAAGTRSRWPGRVAVAAGVTAGVLGLGAAASAAGILPGWPSFSTSSGQTCSIEVWAEELAPGEGEPSSSTFTAAEREETLAAARAYLDDFDYGAVDRDEAIAAWQGAERRVRAAQDDPAERQPRLTGDDLEVTAVSRWVIDHLRTHLATEGLDIRAVMVGTSTTGCTL